MPELWKSAGVSSQRMYDELVRSWRRRHRKVFAVVAVICGALFVASFVAAERWPSLGWGFGLFGGAAAAFWLIAQLSPPAWVENWQQGAWGEQATEKVLRELEQDDWIVLHDLPAGRGNVDHIAIGPGGVYLLDSKRLGGSVVVDDRGVTVRRLDDSDLMYQHPGSRHLLSLAAQTHSKIVAARRISIWVTPVMVLWAEFPQRVAEQGCFYVHGDELVAWLRARPQTIAPSRLRQVADAVRASWESEISASHS